MRGVLFTTRIPKEWERYCFHRCLSVNRGWVPHLHSIILPSTGPMSFPGGYPSAWSHVPSWEEYPFQSQWGVPHPVLMGYLSQVSMGYPPPIGTGWGYPPGQDWIGWNPPPFHWDWIGVPPPPGDRSGERVLAMRRAVCLLRSCRRTFLLNLVSLANLGANYIPFSHNNQTSVSDEITAPGEMNTYIKRFF